MKNIFFLFLIMVMTTNLLAEEKNYEVCLLRIYDSRKIYSWDKQKPPDTASVEKISILKDKETYNYNTRKLWSSTVDHIAFWEIFRDSSVLAIATGGKDTDFQDIIFFSMFPEFKKIMKFTPLAMSSINIIKDNNNLELFVFTCFNAKKREVKFEKIELTGSQTLQTCPAKYTKYIRRVSCRISHDGKIILNGMGLQDVVIPYKISDELLKKHDIATAKWNVFKNTNSFLILRRQDFNNKNNILIYDKTTTKCAYYEFYKGFSKIERFNKKILISDVGNSSKSSGMNYLVDLDNQKILSLVFPENSRILFLDNNFIVLALSEYIRILKFTGSQVKLITDIPLSRTDSIKSAWMIAK